MVTSVHVGISALCPHGHLLPMYLIVIDCTICCQMVTLLPMYYDSNCTCTWHQCLLYLIVVESEINVHVTACCPMVTSEHLYLIVVDCTYTTVYTLIVYVHSLAKMVTGVIVTVTCLTSQCTCWHQCQLPVHCLPNGKTLIVNVYTTRVYLIVIDCNIKH